jgi:hypothetical protein
MKKAVFATLAAVLAVVVAAPSAQAIDIHNCTPAKLMLEFYNESDRIELIYKKRIDIAAGGAVTNIAIPGAGTHKAKLFNASAGKRHLATYRAIDANLSYVLFVEPAGTIAFVTGTGCAG